jgi:hypothetical protein
MQDRSLKRILEDALGRLGYSVKYDRLEDGTGGHYRLREKREVVIDTGLTEEEKIWILIDTLKEMDTSSLYLPPNVRALLGEDVSSEGWD